MSGDNDSELFRLQEHLGNYIDSVDSVDIKK